MTIALFSDIHANLPAFEAMLQDMDKRNPDAIYCLGDLVGYHIWPNEIIAEIRDRKIATLKGNHDEKVERVHTTEESLTLPGKDYAYHLIDREGRNYLKTLPSHIRLEYKINAQSFNIVMAHGSTRSINEYILEDTNQQYIEELMEEAKADILVVGHSHKPYYRTLLTAEGKCKYIINTGSVGKPKDGNPRGCYVLLTLDSMNAVNDLDSLEVEFVRFDYDIEKAAKAIENSLLPNNFAEGLRFAR